MPDYNHLIPLIYIAFLSFIYHNNRGKRQTEISMFYAFLYHMTIRFHYMVVVISRVLVFAFSITSIVYYIDINLNNLPLMLMAKPFLSLVLAYACVKWSYLLRNVALRKIMNAKARRGYA